MDITTLGIDIAKSVFQLLGLDADGAVVVQKKLRRGAVLNFLRKVGPCLIGMEACATSHYWAREIAAFLGLVPRQNSSGGKDRLGRISKMGDRYLRKLLVVGATSVIRRAGSNPTKTGTWVRSLMERKPARVVTVAMANKTARIAWAVMTRGEAYRASPIAWVIRTAAATRCRHDMQGQI